MWPKLSYSADEPRFNLSLWGHRAAWTGSGTWNWLRSCQGSFTAHLGSDCHSGKLCIFHSSHITSASLVWVSWPAQITHCTSVFRCLNCSLQEPCWSLYLQRISTIVDFSPLGRPRHCGRKKKIIMDYTGIAWLKCYQLCIGAGSSITAGRKESKLPTLLVEKTQFVKFKSAFRLESRVISIKGVSTACWETKTIARLGWQRGSQSFQLLISWSIEPGYGYPGVNKCTKQPHLGALRLW